MNQFIPRIGTAGLFVLSAPFDKLLIPNVPYSCIALRTISEISNSGGDVQEDYYKRFELTAADYERDAVRDVCIVTLQAAGYATVDVPATYIAGAPDIGGIPYTALMLTVKLGSLPNTQDLSVVKQKIADDVLELLGVEAVVKPVVISLSTLIPVDQAKVIESARAAKIGTVITDYTKYVKAQRDLESAQQRIAELEEYIRTKIPPV